MPGWAFGVIFLNFIIFLPALLWVGYTLNSLQLTLAMIEDPNPPAYEALSADDADPEGAAATAAPEAPKPITSSIRATSRLLRSVGGWRSHFRGFWCLFTLGLLTFWADSFFTAFTFKSVGSLLASLALVQFSTAWVIIITSQPSPKSFWRRLPPLKKTFEATCFPTLIYWLTHSFPTIFLLQIARLLKLPIWQPSSPGDLPRYDGHAAWKGLIVLVVSIAFTVFFAIPSQVVLRRVQASLIPPEEDAIVPFDRSFDGKVEPAIVGGKGYVTMKDAWVTFPRASWIRVYKLYFKIFLVTFAVQTLFFATFLITVTIGAANSPPQGSN
ncbi:hypothetical protein GQ53DRAFT_644045 [Thozetella sp. PMI_491]|nr:hypothetical protein GQ53DRAFT_644045 [Thozetella sp. PMI_491]